MMNVLKYTRNQIPLRFFLVWLFLLSNCSVLFYRLPSIEPVKFDYKSVAKAHFQPKNELPFPLTVRRSNNLYNSISSDGRYLFFSSDTDGNFNIYVRDLESSVVMPLTLHPAADYKPSVSPDGTKLLFVSERFDSEGDIILIDLKTEKWIRNFVRGSNYADTMDIEVLTNRNYKEKEKIIRALDTDPGWSPDGRYIIYVSDLETPGITNLILLDTQNEFKSTRLTEEGAVSPSFSPDGKSIYFVSYRDHESGEIYSLDISSKTTKRITNDAYYDMSPSLSPDGKFLYYSSIRKDTNGNGSLGPRDDGIIVRLNLLSGESSILSAGNYPIFDTKYSNFIDGSIVFTAALENAHNIYFIPIEGEIPRQETIDQQYETADRYRERSVDFSKLAFQSISLFHEEDKLFPLYKSRSDRQIVKDLESENRDTEAETILEDMLLKKGDPNFGFSYALAYGHKARKKGANPIPELLDYFESQKDRKDIHPQIAPSILQWTGEMYEDLGKSQNAYQLYQTILENYPDFYRILEVKKSLGHLDFEKNRRKIPEYYLEIFGDPNLSRENSIEIYSDILKSLDSIDDLNQRRTTANFILESGDLKTANPEIYGLISYVLAKILHMEDKFDESNRLIETYLSSLNPKSFVYLRSKLLMYDNYKDLEDNKNSQLALLDFIQNYDYKSGVDINIDDFESTLHSFETLARNQEIKGNLGDSILNYSRNNEFLSISQERGIPIYDLFTKYSSYYQKKMIDTSLAFSQKKDENLFLSVVDEINILNNDRVDILGRTTGTLAYLFRYKSFRLFGDFRDLQFVSAFDEDAFSQSEEYFENRLEKARVSLDFGTIYGYSYYLISRSVAREKFYLEENILTESRKSSILQDLKKAEYNLNWIIFAQPDYADAYLLLGWMYQYIDVRRNTIVFPEDQRDGEVFESIYYQYFPRKYLEENVELFTQILDFKEHSPNKKLLSDLHLNLANNFFLLNDYQNAQRHYKKVETLSTHIIPRVQFENYQQKALYLFNYARSFIYNGDTENSISYLTRALDLYYENEYYQLISSVGVHSDREKEKESLEQTKKKLALIHTLIGMGQLELELYDDAVLSFMSALSMNGESKYINDINLYNALAICYQKIGDYKRSEESLKQAELEYIERQSPFRDFFGNSIWDYLFPNDLRVIGEGRFASELPLNFSNLITQGIRIQNNLDKNEFTSVSKLYSSRTEYIKKHSLDETITGEKILEVTISQSAYNEFLRGNYFKSSELYTHDYTEKLAKGKIDAAFDAYLRSDIALFSHIEENSENVDTLLSEIQTNLKFLNVFKGEKLRVCLQELDIEKQDPDICEEKFLKKFPEYEISLAYNYFYSGELYRHKNDYENAYLSYGMMIPIAMNPANIPDSEIGLETDPFTMKQRIRLKILASLSYLRIGEKKRFSDLIREAFYLASEFQTEKELLSIYLIQAEYTYLNATNEKEYKEALEFTRRAENILKFVPGIWYSIDEIFLNYLYSMRTNILIKLKSYKELSENRERMYSAIFFRQLLINELRFQDYRIFDALNDLQLSIQEDKEFQDKLEYLVSSRRDTKSLLVSRDKNTKILQERLKRLLSLLPEGMDISSWLYNKPSILPSSGSNEVIIELFSNGYDYVHAIYDSGKVEYSSYSVNDRYNEDDISAGLLENLSNRNSKNLVIIPSPLMYKINFNSMVYNGKTLNDFYNIRYLFRLSQLKREEKTEFSRLKRITSVFNPGDKKEENGNFQEIQLNRKSDDKQGDLKDLNLRVVTTDKMINFLTDTDILEGPIDFQNRKLYIGEKRDGLITLKEVAENQWNIPLLVVNNYNRSLDNYIKTGFMYDILQFAGVQSIVLIEDSEKSGGIRNELLSDIKLANEQIKNKKLILLGEAINPYPEDQKIYEEEFRRYTEKAVKEERVENHLNSMKYLLQANSVLPEGRPDLLIESELNLDRLKLKLFRGYDCKQNHDFLLSKFPENSIESEKILFDYLMKGYEYRFSGLDPYYDKYMENPNAVPDRKFIIEYFRALNSGDIQSIQKGLDQFKLLNWKEDRFLLNIRLAKLFSNITLWNHSLEYINQAIRDSRSELEKSLASDIKNDILYELYFINGIDLEEGDENKILSLAKNRLWEKYNSKIDDNFKIESDYYKKNYQIKIYKAFEALENSSDFKPISLSPMLLKDGKPSLFLLRDVDRMFLFHLLIKSIPYQTGEELNNQFDLLLKTEIELNNQNRGSYMKVQWASALFHRGDILNASKYLESYEENLENNTFHSDLHKYYLLLKYKLHKRLEKNEFSEEEKIQIKKYFSEWYDYYEEIDSIRDPKKYYPVIERLISDKKSTLLDDHNRREFIDFLEMVMNESLVSKSDSDFFNLGYYRDSVSMITSRLLDRTPKFSDLKAIHKNLANNLVGQLPTGQTISALIDHGIYTYRIKFFKNEITLEKIFDDNRMIKNEILDYHDLVKDFGEGVIKQKYIESIYREKLGLEANQLTYLYFPHYHFKVSLEPKELDNFYFVNSLEYLVDRKPQNSHNSFESNFKVQSITPISDKKNRILNDIVTMEVKLASGTNPGNSIVVSMEELKLESGRVLKFNKQLLPDLRRSLNPGAWIFVGSLLSQSSVRNDDYFHSMKYLDTHFIGPGVILTGYQKDIHIPFFLRHFLKKSGSANLFERYTDAYSVLETEYRQDKYWNGWKTYTNTFLKE